MFGWRQIQQKRTVCLLLLDFIFHMKDDNAIIIIIVSYLPLPKSVEAFFLFTVASLEKL